MNWGRYTSLTKNRKMDQDKINTYSDKIVEMLVNMSCSDAENIIYEARKKIRERSILKADH